MNKMIDKAVTLFEEYKLDEAKKILEQILEQDKNNIKAQLFLGKVNTRTQNYGDAINCFNKVLEKDSENAEAKTGLTLIKGILQLTNNFYFENSYTDDDLYELKTY